MEILEIDTSENRTRDKEVVVESDKHLANDGCRWRRMLIGSRCS